MFAGECSVSLVERPSAQQCIPLHHEMSGYEGMISDILTVCLFLISLPCSSIKMILQAQFIYCVDEMFNVYSSDVYGYMYIYKSEYKCL